MGSGPAARTTPAAEGQSVTSNPEFDGLQDVRVDERLRVAIPAMWIDTLRELSGITGDDPLEVVVGMTYGSKLGIFPVNVHRKLLEDLDRKPNTNAWRKIRGVIRSTKTQQVLDKQRRVRIPAILATRLHLTGNVVLLGMGDHIELQALSSWEAEFGEHVENFDALVEQAEEEDFRRGESPS